MLSERYSMYLCSPEWRRLCRRVVKRAGGFCEACHRRLKRMNVHHVTYDRIFHEELSDLQLLCRRCHRVAHGALPAKKRPPKDKPQARSYIRRFNSELPAPPRTSRADREKRWQAIMVEPPCPPPKDRIRHARSRRLVKLIDVSMIAAE